MKFIKTLEEFISESKVKSDEKIDILRDSNYIVVQPLTHRASCKYGAYTKWCISVPNAEYVWTESSDHDNLPYIVIFIIQRNYKNPNNDTDIERLIYLNDIIQNGDDNGDSINEEDHEEYLELFASHNGEDLSKIALIFTNKNRISPEIWDNNNINLDDVYNSYFQLPIDNYVLDKIEEYVANFKYDETEI